MFAVRRIALVVLALAFMAAGANHFVHPGIYARMVPAWLPAHALLVGTSGAGEILGGAGALVPGTRKFAGLGLIALLVAVFPANVEMALHPGLFSDLGNAPEFYFRLPLQLVAIAWVWWVCVADWHPQLNRPAA